MCSPEDIVVLRFLVTGKVFQCISRTDGLGPEILECENQQMLVEESGCVTRATTVFCCGKFTLDITSIFLFLIFVISSGLNRVYGRIVQDNFFFLPKFNYICLGFL